MLAGSPVSSAGFRIRMVGCVGTGGKDETAGGALLKFEFGGILSNFHIIGCLNLAGNIAI